jgi:hypothetical protein
LFWLLTFLYGGPEVNESERQLDLALGDERSENARLREENARLHALVGEFARRLLAIERLANVAFHASYTRADESSGETD